MTQLIDDSESTVVELFQPGTPAPTPAKDTKPKWQLKKLTTKHKRIVALKVAGLSRADIAEACGCTPEYVTMLMNQPLVIAMVEQEQLALDQDLRDLTGEAVTAIRRTIRSGDDAVALRSAELVLKSQGKLTPNEVKPGETAEDFVSRIMQINNSQVQVNINQVQKET